MKTRGGLESAAIINKSTNEKVECMFNPYEYTIAKQNQWKNGERKGGNVPKVDFVQGGAETLRLMLFFDTYEDGSGKDVREYTHRLWKMMLVTEDKKQRNNKSVPPYVIFSWGKFEFEAVITSLSQTFTLFAKDGTPLRTTVDITLQEANDRHQHEPQNPTSGGGPPKKLHIVQAGERLDLIANKEYGDASLWRLIASENRLIRPLKLREGQTLIIPALD